MSRPKQFDGTPLSVRLPSYIHDDLCREALCRDVDLAQVMRERLSVSQFTRQAQTSAQ